MSQISITGSGGGGGGGVLTINGNTGTATPVAGVINLITDATNIPFIASGNTVTLEFRNDPLFNVMMGGTYASVAGAQFNSALGVGSLNGLTSGSANVAIGFQTMGLAPVTGSDNTALGAEALNSITSGSENTIIGRNSGDNYTSSESNNIILGYNIVGVTGESNVIRIGNDSNTSCNITGIFGSTVTGSAVLCDSTGLLGTVVSSERYKENIESWTDEDQKVLQLSVKKFNYKSDTSKTTQYGLIAEEVEKIMPNLVVYGKNQQIESVKYHELPVFLLDIIQNQSALIQDLNRRVSDLEAR